MNYLVISPYYPQNFQQFTIELANKGITVLGIGQEPYEQLDEPLRNSLTEYFRVYNLENIDEVKRAVAFLFYKPKSQRGIHTGELSPFQHWFPEWQKDRQTGLRKVPTRQITAEIKGCFCLLKKHKVYPLRSRRIKIPVPSLQ